MVYELRGGVLIIGSLYWQDDSKKGDGKRKRWREDRLDMTKPINVSVPIRYGRFSGSIETRNQTYTMIFDNDLPKEKYGQAKVLFFKNNPTSWNELKHEVEALSSAEGQGERFIKWSSATREAWCICAICFNPKIDSRLKSQILNNWEKALKKSEDGYPYFIERAHRYNLSSYGELSIPWPVEANEFDYLIATSTQPRNREGVIILTAQEIANHVPNRDYLIPNVNHGILTYQDSDIKQMETSEQYYSRTWESASLAYKERRFYKWCLERIPSGINILEIGTGIGIVMSDLIEAGFIVSSLEENNYNLDKARKRLSDSGKEVNFLMSIKEAREHFGKNNLIKSNFILDWNEVVNVVKYDTVICWLVGVHHNAHENPELIELGYNQRDFGHYRHLIYNRIFQVISLRLPVGGIISLVERVGTLTSDQVEEEIKGFSDYYELEKYGLKLEKIEQLPIGNITDIPGIKMVAVKEGAQPFEEPNSETAIISYIIVKFRELES